MLHFCFFLLGAVSVLLLSYNVFELHYFLRALVCVTLAKFFKKKVHVLNETHFTGICLSTDIDYLMDHMNNARYIRELDFAKIDFYERTSLYKRIKSKGGNIYAGATTIRYRRFIKVFSKYCISTKIIYWDDQNIYIEHKFTTKRGFVNAIALSRVRLVKVRADEIIQDLTVNLPEKVMDIEAGRKERPQMPEELQKWIESNQISSEKLRENNKIDYSEEVITV